MAVDLVRLEDAERLTLSNQQWSFILTIAEKYGWKPLGTAKIDDDGNTIIDWNKSDYTSNDGQIVCGNDADSIAHHCSAYLISSSPDTWEIETINSFIHFSHFFDDASISSPGFEIW